MVKAGSFDFKPNKWFPLISPKRIGYWTVFDESCRYMYPDPAQQGDWLKLGGISFNWNPGNKHQDSIMIAFRYNPQTDRIELSLYYHREGQVIPINEREVMTSVAIGERFVWWIRVDSKQKFATLNIRNQEGLDAMVKQNWKNKSLMNATFTQAVNYPKGLPAFICWEIGAWAGGDIPAVQDMKFTASGVNEWGLDGPVDPLKQV